jgi:nitrate/nitrite-specific signal transduction histidine kinase
VRAWLDGDTDQRVQLSQQDELGILADDLDRLADKLAERDQRLIQSQRNIAPDTPRHE